METQSERSITKRMMSAQKGNRNPSLESFDPVRHARQQVAVEAERLHLRELREAHRSLDEKEAARAAREAREREAARQKGRETAERRAREVREVETARLRARAETEEKKRREAAEAATRKRRAEFIQNVLDETVERYWDWKHEIPTAAKAEALQEVRRELSGLPDLEDIPAGELREIAVGIRDKVYQPIFEAQSEAKRREAERREAVRREEEERRRQAEQAMEERFRKEKLRTTRIEAGSRRAKTKLEGVMTGWDRQSAINAVEAALCRELTGDESLADVEKLVDEILAPRLSAAARRAAEQETERRKGKLVEYGKRFLAEQCAEELPPSGIDRFLVSEQVKQALEKELTGDESEEDVENLVEDVLDEEVGK